MTKNRNTNMDLLRMLSMMMVTMLHALGKSGLLLPISGDLALNGWLAWIMECFSIGAVNIFMLLSGYFLIKSQFRTGRLLELIFQTFFYTFGTFFLYFATGKIQMEQMDIYHLLKYYLPVHMDVYWFITAYVALYLLLPVLSQGVLHITQKQLGRSILFLLVYECFVKSVLPFRLEEDARGYSLLWYVILFLIGAYYRLYGFRFLKKAWQGWLLFVIGSGAILFEIAVLYYISSATGRLSEIVQIALDYNHVFTLLAAVGIFGAFLLGKQLPQMPGRLVSKLSPYALGVYLFQENEIFRYEWQIWFGLQNAMSQSTAGFLCRVIGAVLAMYALGTAIDFVRSLIFRLFTHFFSGRKKATPSPEG